MTINRHPLQSIGVGQNSRMLPDEAVVPYCDALGERLAGWPTRWPKSRKKAA